MAKEEAIEVEGRVLEPLPNAMFRVELETGIRFWRTYPAKCACILFKILPGTRVNG